MAETLLQFELNGARYALAARRVLAVAEAGVITPVPCMPPYLAGVCALRGELVPVVDVTKLWGGERREAYRCLIRLEHGGAAAALLADAVLRTVAVEGLAGGDGRFIRGVTADGTAVLDISKVLRAVFGEGQTGQ